MMISKLKIIVICFFILFLFSCNGSDFIDCSFSPYLAIGDNEPPDGIVGMEYNFTIIAEIANDTADDGYDYWFNITGNLPPGLISTSEDRYLNISGTPQAAGEYDFFVYAATPESENNYDSDSCIQASDWEDEKLFTIIIYDNA